MHKVNAEKYIEERLGGKVPVQLQFIQDIFEKENETGLNFYCAGGAIRSIFDGSEVVDIDLFPTTEDNYEKLLNVFHQYTVLNEKENDYNMALEIEFKTAIKNAEGEELEEIHNLKIQVIKIHHEKIEDLIYSFDFTICMFGYDRRNDLFVIGENSIEDLFRKRLVINEVTYHLSTFRRFFKYAKKGFHACSGCLKTFMSSVRNSENNGLDDEPEYID